MPRLAKLLIISALFGVLGTALLIKSRAAEVVFVQIDTNTVSTISNFRTGTTFTQYSLDRSGDPTAVALGKSLLSDSTLIVNQHLMGFGANNPEPSPGIYDFNSLDKRINKETGVAAGMDTVVLTACCAPDWMKGGTAGQTDWTQLEVAPLPDFYDDYAKLVAEVVKQPQFSNVKYIQVWNEMKGFFDKNLGRWNYEGYTQLYNLVWTEVKAVRPDIQIGGPYVVMSSNGGPHSYNSDVGGPWGLLDKRNLDVVEYWLQNKIGADFITIDGKNKNKDGIELVDEFGQLDKFAAIYNWIRSLDEAKYPGSKSLPIWWGEWYARPVNETDTHPRKNALMAAGLARTIKSGATTALIWGPQGDIYGNREPLAIFTDTRVSGGGQPTLFYDVQLAIRKHFGAGTELVTTTSNSSKVDVLASRTKVMFVNTSPDLLSVNANNTTYELAPYQVMVADAPTSGGGSSIPEDINEDGCVNALDFLIFKSKFGQIGDNLGRADINGDGAVNALDFLRFKAAYSTGPSC